MTDEQRARKRANDKRYREAHSARLRERRAAYYLNNRDKVLETNRQWRGANKERVRAAWDAWEVANNFSSKDAQRRYRETHPERVRCSDSAWREKSPDKVDIYRAKTCLAAAAGMTTKDVPISLAEAKAAQLRVGRAIKEFQ